MVLEEIKEKIGEYERSLISDLEKMGEVDKDADNGIESIKEIKDITYGQLYAVQKIQKLIK